LSFITNIQFERVVSSEEQIKHLYELLKQRKYSISHGKIPDYDKHYKFVKNHPYLHWFIVKDEKKSYGSFYIKNDNSIGMNLELISEEILISCLDFIKNNFNPQEEKNSLIPKYFYINVAYSNKKFLNALKELDLLPIQISFKLET